MKQDTSEYAHSSFSAVHMAWQARLLMVIGLCMDDGCIAEWPTVSRMMNRKNLYGLEVAALTVAQLPIINASGTINALAWHPPCMPGTPMHALAPPCTPWHPPRMPWRPHACPGAPMHAFLLKGLVIPGSAHSHCCVFSSTASMAQSSCPLQKAAGSLGGEGSSFVWRAIRQPISVVKSVKAVIWWW